MFQRNSKVVYKIVHDTFYKSLTILILQTITRTTSLFSDNIA